MEPSPNFVLLGLAVLIVLVWFIWERGRKIRFAEEGSPEPLGFRFVRGLVLLLTILLVLAPDDEAGLYSPPLAEKAHARSAPQSAVSTVAEDPCQPEALENVVRDMIFWQRRTQKAALKLDLEGVRKAESLVRAYALDIAQCPDEDKVSEAFQRAVGSRPPSR